MFFVPALGIAPSSPASWVAGVAMSAFGFVRLAVYIGMCRSALRRVQRDIGLFAE